jgi:hypothetical protein
MAFVVSGAAAGLTGIPYLQKKKAVRFHHTLLLCQMLFIAKALRYISYKDTFLCQVSSSHPMIVPQAQSALK